MTKRVAGIDVGKQEVAVSVARGPVHRFPNTAAGLTAVLAWAQEQAVTHVVCEATGGMNACSSSASDEGAGVCPVRGPGSQDRSAGCAALGALWGSL